MWWRLSVGFVLIAVLAAVDKAAAATYVVGDSLGWTVPSGGPATYTTWASPHVFRVGDVLVFNFSTGAHDVAQVTKAAYDGCSSNSPILLATVGPSRVTLNSTGEHYYICTFGQHCSLGQKLAINVTTTTTSPTPAPAPAPSSGPTITPVPSRSPSQTPSPGPTGPSPAPSGGPVISPVPSPAASGSSPQLAPRSSTLPADGLTPPPAPSSAMVATFSMPFVVLALTAYGLLI